MATSELSSNLLSLAQHMGRSTDVDTLEKASDRLDELEQEVVFKTNELGKYILRTANAESLLSELAAIIDNADGVLSPFDGKPDLLSALRLFTGKEASAA